MVSSLNRTFAWLVAGAFFTWSHIFLVMKRSPSTMIEHGRHLVHYDDYVQSFSLLRNQSRTDIVSQSSPEPRYRRSKTLPQWMKGLSIFSWIQVRICFLEEFLTMHLSCSTLTDYFDWHKTQTMGLNETNFDQNRYLILRCTKKERKCGGVADRLKSIPFFIAAAARTNRIFMIRWGRPTKLEEFLLPNEVNWSVPDWMVEKIETNNVTSHMRPHGTALMRMYKRERSTVLESLLQDFYGGSALYYKIQAEIDNSTTLDRKEVQKQNMAGWSIYERIFHDLFRSLFQPSEAIAKLVRNKMQTANLTAGKYVSCHHRAFYAIEDKKHRRKARHLRKKALNAINCASIILPGAPIYFASDSQESIRAVRHTAIKGHRPIVTTHEDTKEALHLDKAENWTALHPSEFYPTFVDLLIMANGRCTAYGAGGFGRFGALLSYDSSCIIKHNEKPKTTDCRWTDSVPTIPTATTTGETSSLASIQ